MQRMHTPATRAPTTRQAGEASVPTRMASRPPMVATWQWGDEDKKDAIALLMEVLTPWGKRHVLATHAPQINFGLEPYVR